MTQQPDHGKTLVLIPAKAGSVRLPMKNVRPLKGVSLLARTIRRAQKMDFVDRICVSTEDEVVAEQARECGVDVPFMRPAHLARDPAGVVDVALHALDMFEQAGERYDTLIILLPTSPFCRAQDIADAMRMFVERKVEFLMSVSKEVHSPLSSLILKDGCLSPLHPEWLNRTGAKAGDDLPVLVRSNGAVTIVDVSAFRRERNYYGYPLAAYEMPWERSIDIDTEMDFQFAQFLADHIDGLLD
jgi:N-acylneuraminate cytidylyltransferase/CMP-N,N'-diacetyllegionaminic acid synthase